MRCICHTLIIQSLHFILLKLSNDAKPFPLNNQNTTSPKASTTTLSTLNQTNRHCPQVQLHLIQQLPLRYILSPRAHHIPQEKKRKKAYSYSRIDPNILHPGQHKNAHPSGPNTRTHKHTVLVGKGRAESGTTKPLEELSTSRPRKLSKAPEKKRDNGRGGQEYIHTVYWHP